MDEIMREAAAVSGGDMAPAAPSQGMPLLEYAAPASVSGGDAGMPPGAGETLAETNALLSAILFVLLFGWCEKKIRAAVSKMAGRKAG